MKITVHTLLLVGLRAVVTPVHVEVVRGPGEFHLAGLRESSCRETRVRVCAALQQSGVHVRDWTIRVTAEPLPGASGQIDLAAAVGALVGVGQLSPSDVEKTFFVGELSLTGDVRPIRGVCLLVAGAAENSPTGHMVPSIVVPWDNQAEAARAAQIWNDPISDDFADLRSSERDWEMVSERSPVFYLRGEPKKQLARAWIRMFGGEGLFADTDRCLDPERAWEL